MKRETKIDQTYFLSETKTSTPMKSNHLKERIVFLPHPLSGILGSVLFQNLIHMTLQRFAVKIQQCFFWVESDPNLELFVPGSSHSILFGADGKKQMFFSLPES